MWWIGGLAVLLAIAVAVAVASGGGSEAKAGEVSPKITVKGDPLPPFEVSGFGDRSDPAIGMTPPEITGQTFAGKTITFGGTAKPRMVLFVAHWCPHCQREVPLLVELARGGGFDGVDVQTIATGTTPDNPNYPPSKWLKREQWPFPVLADDARYRAADTYGLQSYPYFVFVDAENKVALRATGELDPADLRKVLSALAAGKDPIATIT
jgi:thiol-disulfide isomerase/thioredoxin